MNEEAQTIYDTLRRVKPAEVLVFATSDAKEPAHRMDVRPTGKRWEQITSVLCKLEWSRIELRSRSGSLLDVITAVEDIGPPPELATSTAATQNDRDLDRLLRAQNEVAKWRSQDTQLALNAAVNILDKCAQMIGGLVELQQLQIDRAKAGGPAMLPAGTKPDDLAEAMDLAKMILPMLGAGGGKPPAPAVPPTREKGD